jgi:chloramphenicol-sensitive protein RarD
MNRGTAYGLLAFTLWGAFPLYFNIVPELPALEVLMHRVVWSLALLLAILAWRRHWAWLPQVLRQPRTLGTFAASSVLLSVNWLTYIWAVTHGHIVDASLGYFVTPLINVLLGYTLLHERPRRGQWLALALAGLGVLWLALLAGHLPWIALVLAASFAGYGLLRKIAVLGALEGLTLETLLLGPIAFVGLWAWWGRSSASFPSPDILNNLWLVGLGPVTAVPLLLFAAAARRLSLTALGLLQYLTPMLQFACGVWLFDEPFTEHRLIGFMLIWLALLLYSADGWRVARRRAA